MRSPWRGPHGTPSGATTRASRGRAAACATLELFERAVKRKASVAALNVLLYGESTFHQVHGGAGTSVDGYFRQSQEEYVRVTGRAYKRPSYPFLADLGEKYDRLGAVGRFLVAHQSHA